MQYYHQERPHLALGNLPPAMIKDPVPIDCLGVDDLVCHERLGRFLKHYERKAA